MWLHLVFAPVTATAEDPANIDNARKLEQTGKTLEAVEEYERWLEANTAAADYVQVLLHAAQIAPTASQAMHILQGGLSHVEHPGDRAAVERALGSVAEMTGDLDAAQSSFAAAFSDSLQDEKDYKSLLRSAELLLEIGQREEAAKRAAQVKESDPALRASATLLLARIAYLTDGPLAAYGLAEPLAQDPAVEPGTMLFLVETAEAAGKHEDALRTFDELKHRYAKSPEVALAARLVGKDEEQDGQVSYLASPSRVLGPIQEAAAETASAVPEDSSDGQPGEPDTITSNPEEARVSQPDARPVQYAQDIAIQTGAFTEGANAQKMADELGKRGYNVSIRVTQKGDTKLNQVIVAIPHTGPSETPTDPQPTILRLKADGFDGFVVDLQR